MTYEFKLPDIGEGLIEGEVVKWHVKEGDQVCENQPLVTVLTDKAEVEIPSPKTGVVTKLAAGPGQKVAVHATLVTFELGGNGSQHPAAAPTKEQSPAAARPGSAPTAVPASNPGGVSALPAVRKLAADLKVELGSLKGSGPQGRITEDDVRKASGVPGKPNVSAGSPPAGPEERVPFVGIRRRTAEKMATSKRTVAHVTHMDECDFTALVELREGMKGEAATKGVKLTYLPFIITALVKSLKEFPDLNAVLDEAGGAVVRKRYYNIGIATAAEQGLVVPVVKSAETKDLWTLAGDVNGLADRARANKVEVSEIQGGTFTITNIGPIGGLFATPIVNHPEVGILGIMKLRKQPVVRGGAVEIRDMVNLVLSFDHRVVDGAEAARFMNTLVKHLENPRTLLR